MLRRDPGGIAPERALVFVAAVPIANFVRAARLVGLEVLAELDLDEDYALDEELIVEHRDMVSQTLYATMPTRESFETLLRLWRVYQQGERPEDGYAPWRQLFEMLDELRGRGPEDRPSAAARAELADRLAGDGAAEVRPELEVWPTRSGELRERWRREAEQRVAALGGRVVSRCSIEEEGFVYEALLVALSAGAVREMMADSSKSSDTSGRTSRNRPASNRRQSSVASSRAERVSLMTRIPTPGASSGRHASRSSTPRSARSSSGPPRSSRRVAPTAARPSNGPGSCVDPICFRVCPIRGPHPWSVAYKPRKFAMRVTIRSCSDSRSTPGGSSQTGSSPSSTRIAAPRGLQGKSAEKWAAGAMISISASGI